MTQDQLATLHLVCGKAGAGKSTLCAALEMAPQTVALSEDRWLDALYGDQMSTLQDYVRCSGKLRTAIAPHIIALLKAGTSVVLDFQANTIDARAWMLDLATQAGTPHQLHYLDVPDDVCKARLRVRNASGTHPFTLTDEQFDQLTRHFVPPTADEGLTINRHEPTD